MGIRSCLFYLEVQGTYSWLPSGELGFPSKGFGVPSGLMEGGFEVGISIGWRSRILITAPMTLPRPSDYPQLESYSPYLVVLRI